MSSHSGTHDVEMGIIDGISFFRSGGNNPERLRINYFMPPVGRFADFAHTDAAVNAGNAHP
jgi:hypothetical protein